jgi:CRP-like cAMP-binding protein
MPDREIVDFLASVPLLEGQAEADLAEVARVVRRRSVAAGELLWRQGDEAGEMLFVVDGALSASLAVPGDRSVRIGTARAGDVVGEIGLLDGGGYTMSVRVEESATLLALGRLDVVALLAARNAAAFALKRQLAALFTARLRNQMRYLADTLGGEPNATPAADMATPAELEKCGPPDSTYVRRMTAFHDFDPVALWGFLTSGTYVRCPPGRTLIAEGVPAPAYYLTINGAVERVLVRGDWRIRTGLAGPGRAVGCESLIDAGPSPVTAITRERSLLLVIPPGLFEQLLQGEDAVSRSFLDVIQKEMIATLRETLRPCARLGASV